MTTTSLGLATDGLLDRGTKPALHMASFGHIRYGGTIEPPEPGGGGGGPQGGARRRLYVPPPLPKKERERLERLRRGLTAASQRELDTAAANGGGDVDVQRLLEAIERETLAALAKLPKREPSGRKQRAPKLTILPAAYIREPVKSPFDYEYYLRLVLLLGTP